MAWVVPFHAFWKQAFPPALASARQRRAAAFCSHAPAKTVLAFARAF